MDAVNDRPHVLGNRYEVGELLGRGGMAEVHIGRDTRLGRVVAIKLLRTDLARDATFQARFRREAQSAAALNHPAIVSVYDTGEEQIVEAAGGVVNLPYIVMEYVEGRTLRELLQDGHPLDVDTALDVTARVLSALEYSHRGGIVHRDIKPANVMVTPNGDVKVMDFGIARAMSDASSAMTQTQAVIGTAQYLSPEQARGETVDARSDLYSAGCLLYELLTGRPPFVADSPVAVAYQHVREEPQPPSVHNPAVPEAVDRIVLHALAKDRETRYQTADEFRADIEAALAGRPVSAYAAGAGAAAGAATTQFLGAAGGGTRTMQSPVSDPYTGGSPTAAVPGAVGGVGGGMLPGAPVDDDTGYGQRRDHREPDRKRGRGWSYALLALAVLVVAGLVVFAIWKVSGSGSDVKRAAVPTVQGMQLNKALNQLSASGFTNVDSSQTAADEQVPAGAVVSQQPAAGQTLPVTDKITLVVSTGPDAVNVPNVKGLDQNAATAQLQQAGLQIGDVTTKDGNFEKGTVISSKPGIGSSVAKGTKVDLTIASGQVALRDLKGQTQDQAQDALRKLGLPALVETRPANPGEQVGVVVQQKPGKGLVDVGTQVKITVTTAPVTPTPTPTPSASPSPSSSPSPSP
jgi:beta-lactam-binding protein with PASTA domain/predicted Ser/Thr protein kinase